MTIGEAGASSASRPHRQAQWEVEVKVRRNGRLWRRESALGDDPSIAFDAATNDLVRELNDQAAEPT